MRNNNGKTRREFLLLAGVGALAAMPVLSGLRRLAAGIGFFKPRLTQEQLVHKLIHQKPSEIGRLLEADPAGYCAEYQQLLDECLKDNLGAGMRAHLRELKKSIADRPAEFVERRKREIGTMIEEA